MNKAGKSGTDDEPWNHCCNPWRIDSQKLTASARVEVNRWAIPKKSSETFMIKMTDIAGTAEKSLPSRIMLSMDNAARGRLIIAIHCPKEGQAISGI